MPHKTGLIVWGALCTVLFSGWASAASSLKLAVINATKASPWPVSSVLLEGAKEAVLIDAQFTKTDAEKLVEKIRASGRKLTTIYISQGDPDFYFGLEFVKAAFPDANVVAAAPTVARIKATQAEKLKYWGPILKSEAPQHIVLPEPLKGHSLTLEGQQLQIIGLNGKAPDRTFVWIPAIQTVAGGTLVFGNLHVFTADTQTDASKRNWIRVLSQMNALKPATVVPGHFKEGESMSAASIAFTRDYLKTYMTETAKAANSAALIKAMQQHYPDAGFSQALEIGAKVSKGEMKW
jgi:glyoxylase-like metal-dependent hydrolase (beta-lactamase superfamily II)